MIGAEKSTETPRHYDCRLRCASIGFYTDTNDKETIMEFTKFIGLDVHKLTIAVAVAEPRPRR